MPSQVGRTIPLAPIRPSASIVSTSCGVSEIVCVPLAWDTLAVVRIHLFLAVKETSTSESKLEHGGDTHGTVVSTVLSSLPLSLPTTEEMVWLLDGGESARKEGGA